KRISDKRTKNQAKTDKTKHGMEKRRKAKVKSKPKSTPTNSKPRSHQERIIKKKTKNEAKTTKPDSEWKSKEKTKSKSKPKPEKDYENIDYVDASPPDVEIVSLEVVEIVIPEVGGIDDDILLTIKDDILRLLCSHNGLDRQDLVPKPHSNCARVCARRGTPLRSVLSRYLQDTSESSDDNTNVVNAPQSPSLSTQPGENFLTKSSTH
ncbi:hypothetical protein Tco_0892907, partial [Tanacetum coccineum]